MRTKDKKKVFEYGRQKGKNRIALVAEKNERKKERKKEQKNFYQQINKIEKTQNKKGRRKKKTKISKEGIIR